MLDRLALLGLRHARFAGWQGLLIAHDPDGPGDVGPDTVIGVSNTTRTLAAITPRTPVRRTLDLATGSGALALLAARHSGETVATDISERAVRFAAINAAMNGVEFWLGIGDLFEPLAGDERFDLISANLPFVVSPDTAYTFRDSGRTGDAMSRDAITAAAARLIPGGLAVMLCNWIVPDGVAWDATLREWLAPLPCDCVVVHRKTEDPDAYARRWNDFLLLQDPQAYAPTVGRWHAAYEQWRVAGIAAGAIIVRARADGSPGWFHSLSMDVVPAGDGGRQLLRVFANVDQLARGQALLELSPRLVRDHRLEQAMSFDGSWTMQPGRLILHDTAGPAGEVDPLAIHAVLRLDGSRSLASICDAVVFETGLPAEDVRAATLTTCQRLLEAGCLDI